MSYTASDAVLGMVRKGRDEERIKKGQAFRIFAAKTFFPRMFDQACDKICQAAIEAEAPPIASNSEQPYGLDLAVLIELLLEYLPEILEIIQTVIDFFKEQDFSSDVSFEDAVFGKEGGV